MLFRQDILQGIAEGRVTLAFRRWRRAPPADGSSLRSPVGVLSLDRVTVVDEGDITPEDVRRTGLSLDELRASIDGEGTLLRIELRLAGDDPRIALRERPPSPSELEAIVARLARIDAASGAPWTTRYLQADRCTARHCLACACATGGHRPAAVQASCSTAQGARPHRKSRGRLPPLAARPCGTRTACQRSALIHTSGPNAALRLSSTCRMALASGTRLGSVRHRIPAWRRGHGRSVSSP